MTSTNTGTSASPTTTLEERTSDDDIFGVARYLAEAVVHGDITEEDGATALLDWAAPDCEILEHAAMRLTPGSETEHLLRAAYRHAA